MSEERQSCITRIAHPLSALLQNLKLSNSVHPLEPVAPPGSSFIELGPHRRLRIIHIKPQEKRTKTETKCSRVSHRGSLDEYWFTKTNRPIKADSCSCVFRRSQRLSKYSNQLRLSLAPGFRNSIPSINGENRVAGSKVKSSNLDIYVELLVQNILLDAYEEYIAKTFNVNVGGVENTSFDKSEDDLDGICFRKKYKTQGNQNNVQNAKETDTDFGDCTHIDTSVKPAVMLLHGIGSSAEVWKNIFDKLLEEGHEILAPDMLGHGYSSVPDREKAYTFCSLLKDTITIFDQYIGYNESRKCIVIGHSYGCSLACAVARYRAQHIVQLVLISSGGPAPLAPPVLSKRKTMVSCMQKCLMPFLFCGFKRTLFYSPRGKHFDQCDTVTAVPSYVLRYMLKGQEWPEGDAAFHRRILIPTLLVHGLQDGQVTLVQECEMERTIPRAFLEVIPTAGHISMLDTPEQLCHMILCFINWWSM